MRIVHISDLHLPIRLNPFILRRKSLIGYTNFALRRRKKHLLHKSLLESISKLKYDVLIISGDITNISEEKEFTQAKEFLKPILDDRTFIIPGNHDRYTQKSWDEMYFEKAFGEYIGDAIPISESSKEQGAKQEMKHLQDSEVLGAEQAAIEKKKYLRKKVFGDVAIYGWDSNLVLPAMNAQGYVDLDIVYQTQESVAMSKEKEYMVVCHHPIWNPIDRQESARHKLTNRSVIGSILKSNPPSVFYHGHLHTNWVKEPGEEFPFWVVNSASSTRDSDDRHRSGYHILDRIDSQWNIKRIEYNIGMMEYRETKVIVYNEHKG
ncbi:metallophosphoesterase family protein [Leptospira sp. GIMC2001]|uniref:metallophosphoesterase family protein n=1 Tax=Leptospira sp. GIMC2001 TaxID=1513297 RepID=UPI00234B2945|nr:metallophosphoesterase [Leptospira sp. GIMC2001]WCL51312.1 metallophosphoesterase [Leptospira sp. GIMC2001]